MDNEIATLRVNVATRPENVPAAAVRADRPNGKASDFRIPRPPVAADPFARASANTKAADRIGMVGVVRYATEAK